jgi:hypothetical protein
MRPSLHDALSTERSALKCTYSELDANCRARPWVVYVTIFCNTDVNEKQTGYRNAVTAKRTRKLPVTEYQCPQCGDWFVPKHPSATYCSDACRQAAYRERQRKAR